MSRSPIPLPTIIVDTREQRPWCFDSRLIRDRIGGPFPTVRGTLATGDYSVLGIEDEVAIERKSLQDWIQSVTHGRERFFAELERMQEFSVRAVIIEGHMLDIQIGAHRSRVLPQSLVGSALAMTIDFNLPVVWAGDREMAEYCAAWTLRRAWQRHLQKLQEQEAGEPVEEMQA